MHNVHFLPFYTVLSLVISLVHYSTLKLFMMVSQSNLFY